MSLKSLLMPMITARMFAPGRLERQRRAAERTRVRSGEPHRVHYFHQTDDPYSALAAQALPRLAARYAVEWIPHVVGPPADSAAPERERLVAYSRRDAALLAGHHRLVFRDFGRQPPAAAVDAARAALVEAIRAGRFADEAATISERLWRGGAEPSDVAPLAEEAAREVRESDALRTRLGHYLGATFFYGGEWYWGIDRLHHLETRLQALGAARGQAHGVLFAPPDDLKVPTPLVNPPTIDFFFSFRSPYSAIVTPRVFALARLTGAPLRLRHVLPMVMRGLPVPAEKRMYIVHDAAREARLRGVPFGRFSDPVGAPAERGLSIMPLALREGKGESYVREFMHGVWAEGIDAGSDRGLARIVERAGLEWAAARAAIADGSWRAEAEANRREMFDLGLWGVPSFRVGETVVWGQDRLWAVADALLALGRKAQAAQRAAPP